MNRLQPSESQLIEQDPPHIHPDQLTSLAVRILRDLDSDTESLNAETLIQMSKQCRDEKIREFILEKIKGLSIRDLNVLIDRVEKIDRPSKKPKGKAI